MVIDSRISSIQLNTESKCPHHCHRTPSLIGTALCAPAWSISDCIIAAKTQNFTTLRFPVGFLLKNGEGATPLS